MTIIKIDVVSAEGQIFSGQAKFVVLPGESGELGILPLHTPLITRIHPGIVRIETEIGNNELIFVSGGILEVQPRIITVLADTAIRGKDLDEARSEEAKKRAEERLHGAKSDIDIAKAQLELATTIAQLKAIKSFMKFHTKR
ncbi:MAG: F0F1 ATP synthase subunit epsilon [Burkholderia sp.]|nr:F0F1 ATP synthase subunit epsilon [Burkholderia sp.]